MEKFLVGDLTESLELFERQLLDGDTSLSDRDKAQLLANIAFVEFELELYRKCIKSCAKAIEKDPKCIRAYILQGKAHVQLGKSDVASESWSRGLNAAASQGIQIASLDIYLVRELQSLLVANAGRNQSAADAPPLPAGAGNDSKPTHSVEAATELLPQPALAESAPQSTAGTVSTDNSASFGSMPTKVAVLASSQNTENRVTKSPSSDKGTAKAASASLPNNTKVVLSTSGSNSSKVEDSKRDLNRGALLIVHKQFIGTGPNQINPSILAAIRSKISNASGEEITDDLIALGYLHVNTSNLKTACDIFTMLLKYRTDLPAAHLGMGSAHALNGKFDDAISSFTCAIAIDPTIPDAWKRRGQTRAARGLFQDALEDLSRAVMLDIGGSDPDIYFQRALMFLQHKYYQLALADFKLAAQKGMDSNPQLHNFLGICAAQLGIEHIDESIRAHRRAYELDPTFREALLNIAQMHKEVGDWDKADYYFQGVIALSKAQLQTVITNSNSSSSSKGAKPFPQGHWYRAQLLYLIGRPKDALSEVLSAINVNHQQQLPANSNGQSSPPLLPMATMTSVNLHSFSSSSLSTEANYWQFAAICWQAQGYYKQAIDYFDRVLQSDSSAPCWFLREVALATWHYLDADLSTFNLDAQVDPRVKDGLCKKALKSQINLSDYKPLIRPNNINAPSVSMAETNTALLIKLQAVSSWVQLRGCRGFLPNSRQHAMFGLAVAQLAKVFQRHLESVRMDGPGIPVTNASSSRFGVFTNAPAVANGGEQDHNNANTNNNTKPDSPKSVSSSSSGHCSNNYNGPDSPSNSSSTSGASTGKRGVATSHIFGWRDFFDVAVRWRQISEPNDAVFWIDRFPAASFAEGFGLQTAMVTGELRTIRYYSYCAKAIETVKRLLISTGYFHAANNSKVLLSTNDRLDLENVSTLNDLYAITGQDFYVIVPCQSSLGVDGPDGSPLVYEGTRLTLLRPLHRTPCVDRSRTDYSRHVEAYEFSIRTPGTPDRWAQFDRELEHCFGNTVDALTVLKDEPILQGATVSTAVILRKALELFYYWVCFAPLTRGTAACGYIALYAIVLSQGYVFEEPMPTGMQLDWEAILTPHVSTFVDRIAPLLILKPAPPELDVDAIDMSHLVTYRDMLQALSAAKGIA